MLIKDPQQVDAVPMQIEGAEGVTLRVLIGRSDGAPTVAMRHFTVAVGGYTPLHRHNYEHEVLVLSGKALVRSNDTYRGVLAGQTVFVSANELHQFKNTGDVPLEFICIVPVQFDCGNGTCQPTPGT